MIKGIEAVLAHLHARAEQNQPLFGDPAEEAFSRFSSLGGCASIGKLKEVTVRAVPWAGPFRKFATFPPIFVT